MQGSFKRKMQCGDCWINLIFMSKPLSVIRIREFKHKINSLKIHHSSKNKLNFPRRLKSINIFYLYEFYHYFVNTSECMTSRFESCCKHFSNEVIYIYSEQAKKCQLNASRNFRSLLHVPHAYVRSWEWSVTVY